MWKKKFRKREKESKNDSFNREIGGRSGKLVNHANVGKRNLCGKGNFVREKKRAK